MPLLQRKLHITCPLPMGLKPEQDVFVMRCTGEVFRDYETYLKQLAAYRTRQWQCRYTGKANLTYEEALEEEAKSTEGLKKFPAELEAPCIKVCLS